MKFANVLGMEVTVHKQRTNNMQLCILVQYALCRLQTFSINLCFKLQEGLESSATVNVHYVHLILLDTVVPTVEFWYCVLHSELAQGHTSTVPAQDQTILFFNCMSMIFLRKKSFLNGYIELMHHFDATQDVSFSEFRPRLIFSISSKL